MLRLITAVVLTAIILAACGPATIDQPAVTAADRPVVEIFKAPT